ncbi:hypothetical protein AB1Y20_008528 [Prymnesium parvum]|uniref:Protein kinase domain-containing protein n=1 Tax=Prymnesium parvum TaxID=97485 RepID=A0AB34IQJ6_PRYPA
MSVGAMSLEHRGVPWQHVLIGGFVCNGLECQFMGAYMIGPKFPAVTITSHIIDLSSRMGVAHALAYFRKLETLVAEASKQQYRPSSMEWLRKSAEEEFTFEASNVYIRHGALRRFFKADLDTALRHTLHVFKMLKHKTCEPYVAYPIGIASRMRVVDELNPADPTLHTHLLFDNLRHEQYQKGLPPECELYIRTMRGALRAIHGRGVIHANLNPLKCFWKRGDRADSMHIKITDWDLAFFVDCDIPDKLLLDGANPRVRACLDVEQRQLTGDAGQTTDAERKEEQLREMDYVVLRVLEHWAKDDGLRWPELANARSDTFDEICGRFVEEACTRDLSRLLDNVAL